MIRCLLDLISKRLEVVEHFPGGFVLVLLLLLHIISFGSSISILWGWKHRLRMDKPTCS